MTTLIVENGCGLVDANAYIDVAYASVYWGLRKNTVWFGGDPGVAVGSVTFSANPVIGENVTLGSSTYRFVDALSDTGTNEVLIGMDPAETSGNLLAAVNIWTGAGATYSKKMTRNPDVTAAQDDVLVIGLKAKAPGLPGNDVALSATGSGVTLSGQTLSGGTQVTSLADQEAGILEATQYIDMRFSGNLQGQPIQPDQALAFPRTGLPTSCAKGLAVPENLKKATAEYALRALSGPLAPDPTTDPSGLVITNKTTKIGPIEKTFGFATGSGSSSGPQAYRSYPQADGLMTCLLLRAPGSAQGRVIRG